MENHKSLPHIKTLDGWRAIAVIAVILSHLRESVLSPTSFLNPFFAIGINGVDLFFAISGYLIGRTLLSELDQSNTINFKKFYIKRFFRLMPAAWFYLFVIFLMTPALIKVSDLEIVSTMTFWRNYLRFSGLDSPVPSYTAQFWSLMVEEHFYFFLPAFLFFFRKPKKVLISILVIGVSVAIWRKLGTINALVEQYPILEYNMIYTFGRFDTLLYGVLLALAQKEYPDFTNKLKRISPYIPILAIIILFSVKVPMKPVLEALIYPLIFFTTISHENSYISRILENKLLKYIGAISYSLYIWHVLFMYKFESGPEWFRYLGGGWSSLIIIFLLSAMSYHFIENPFRNIGKRFIGR